MQIKVRLFAFLKETIGQEEMNLRLSETASCADVLFILSRSFPKTAQVLQNSWVAVNGRYAFPDQKLFAEDEVAILPPVSGG